MTRAPRFSSFFFFNDTATTEIYTLSLHDALPIFGLLSLAGGERGRHRGDCGDTISEDVVRHSQEEGAVDAAREGDEAWTEVPQDASQNRVRAFHRMDPA